jgi:23S rRNA-/tRNA-specific pseudouridylate synthase
VTARPPLLDRRAGAAEDGQRIDRVVAAWLDEPRTRAQERLAAGEVTIDGAPAGKSARVRAGQQVQVAEPPPPAAPAPPPPPPPAPRPRPPPRAAASSAPVK